MNGLHMPVAHIRSSNGSTLLHYAALAGNAASVEALVCAGVSPTVENKYGVSAADAAVLFGRGASLLQILALLVRDLTRAQLEKLMITCGRRAECAEKTLIRAFVASLLASAVFDITIHGAPATGALK
jgi:ankyrin repeat protein